MRRKCRVVRVGNVPIGGNNPVAIQSMTKTRTADTEKTVRQIMSLQKAGCQIVRLAINDFNDAAALKKIRARVKLPLVADIHFDWRLAIAAIESGADKIRLNPGNIDKIEDIKTVVSALKSADIPLRIGLNSGSVKGAGLKRSTMSDRLVTSCMGYVRMVERLKFNNIVISLKANNVRDTLDAYRKVSRICDYPLHLGLTATGSVYAGIIKSSIALGALLLEGIGDTIRVSLTEEPTEEVRAAKCILESVGLRSFGHQVVSCPTCGRCRVNLVKMVKELEDRLPVLGPGMNVRPMKLAIMGCVVNGPGEAREADIGVAFGRGQGVLFRHGKIIRKVAPGDCVREVLKELKNKEKT
ncbi:MAG: flavodoxin-dependent (E)-4-hydroxy-3-methylbut-2-enyl-diphosphate synthase [Candidatus Omnitrophica bacterium]|nr:flavodoxin-dependent (E)-4-hydroxy-3-methylbut-2-enyl-diphosphate synthase [Candidatus Omnitrophota bacterium]MDD5771455.1 flavodoxin-dependent (E)-4-hydroxy-3-methylbut-2-enyl-diphosphate synthase [Candidatus Omnitrophota bacterium]